MLSHSFHSSSKNCIIHQFKKVAFKIIFLIFVRSLFISIYYFSQGLWLKLITLRTFFKTNPRFNDTFKFLSCITHSVSSCNLTISFSILSILFFPGKNCKSIWSSCNFSRYQLQENILHLFFTIVLLWNLH